MSQWPFIPDPNAIALPPDLLLAVISDTARFTTDGTVFGILDVVRVFHGLEIEQEKKDLIWPLLKKHDLALREKAKTKETP